VKSLEVTINLKAKADGVASAVCQEFCFILPGIASGSSTARVASLKIKNVSFKKPGIASGCFTARVASL
jgi:hypothetical protein